MNDKRVSELLSQNLTSLYGYAFARLYDKDMVDDLVNEIVCEVLESAKNLREEGAFWGFVWKIAENTFRKFIRREGISEQEPFDPEQTAGLFEPSAEHTYLAQEEQNEALYLLRRELSLLSKTHREVCVAYYVENKRCSQIAKEQNISVEMVKYHLFKTRKLLKEGIGMTRMLGEKSYNPGTFRIDFWGDQNHYYSLFNRRLPGSILLAAYYTPMTAEELSMELGVSMPYLEEEIQTLVNAGVLAKTGNTYRTNLVIITEDYEKEFIKDTTGLYPPVAERVYSETKALLPQIRKLDFQGNDYDDNRLLFGLLNIAMVNGYFLAGEKSPIGEANPLALGGNGWVFGYDNDYLYHHFNGVATDIWNSAGNAWFSAEDYRVIEDCQLYSYSNFQQKVEAMCDAILGKPASEIARDGETLPWLTENGFVQNKDGILSANFPVFDAPVYEKVREILRPVSELVADCMIEISDRAEKLLTEHAPAAVKDQCGDIAKIHHRLDASAFLMERLLSDGKLTLPTKKTPLCVWGVKG